VPYVPGQKEGKHPPRRPALHGSTAELQHTDDRWQRWLSERVSLRARVHVHRRMTARRAPLGAVGVDVRKGPLMLAEIVHVSRDQRPAPISGLPGRIQAAFRGRRRESDGRTHGGRFGWLTPPTIPTSSRPTNFPASSRPALRAMPPAAPRADSPRRARDRNGHRDAFRAARYTPRLVCRPRPLRPRRHRGIQQQGANHDAKGARLS
jgi:hypothetical protein